MKDDYILFDTPSGRVWVLGSSVERISGIDSLIFDMDGVLLDVSESIQRVHGAAAEMYFRRLGWTNCEDMVSPDDVDAFKMAGGFNDDWDTANSWTMLYLYKGEHYGMTDGQSLRPLSPTLTEFAAGLSNRGGGLSSAMASIQELCTDSEWDAVRRRCDRKLIEQIFMETYSGDLCPEMYGREPEFVTGPGLVRLDRPILDKTLVPSYLKVGTATGRTRGEAFTAIRLMGWQDIFPAHGVVTMDDGFRKPDPRILQLAMNRLGSDRAVYFGDTPDDLVTAQQYDVTGVKLLSCMVLSGLKHPAAENQFFSEGSDIVADNVNAALTAIQRITGGVKCQVAEQR